MKDYKHQENITDIYMTTNKTEDIIAFSQFIYYTLFFCFYSET
jgi:hypothetical protein